MISNSVTHLRSYTNYAIADIADNSAPISPRECRYRCAEHRCLRPERRRLRPERRSLRAERRESGRIEWRVFECFVMFHNVLRVVHYVLRHFTMYHNVLQVFHDVFQCLTMFYDV